MEFFILTRKTLDSAEFVGSSPVVRATWLCLLNYCVGQENGGVIANASEWGDRKWQQICCVTKKEVRLPSDLWDWSGNNLIVKFYDTGREATVLKLRKTGREAARKRWGIGATQEPNGLPISEPNGFDDGLGSSSPSGEANGSGNTEKTRQDIYTPIPPQGGAGESEKNPGSSELPLTADPCPTANTDPRWRGIIACLVRQPHYPRPTKERTRWQRVAPWVTSAQVELLQAFYRVPKAAVCDETWSRKTTVDILLGDLERQCELAAQWAERHGRGLGAPQEAPDEPEAGMLCLDQEAAS